MTLWVRDGDGFVDADDSNRRRGACPDCSAPWDPDIDGRCPSCSLSRSDLVDADVFLRRLAMNRG